MKRKIQFSGIIFLQLFFFNCAEAQNNNLKFNLVEGPNGKPLGKIKNITQDAHGYMWFSGEKEKCLYRYDGTRFTLFRHDDSNPNSLGGTVVNSVYADNAGIIWIGMNTGFDQFNPATGIFKHYKYIPKDTSSLALNDVGPIIKDRQGRVWIGGSQGLDRFDEKTGKFIHYRNQPGNQKSLSSNFVWTIYEDRQGTIWVGTGFPFFNRDPEDGGLNRLEPDGTFTRFMHDPNNPHSLINNKIAAIFEDSKGTFWVGTSGDGLHTMDRSNGLFARHLYNPKEPGKLSRPPIKPGEENEKITFINEDSTGAIWIGTMYSGINRYDKETKKITHYKGSNGFPDNSGWNAFTSRDGVVWITTEEDNLYRTDPFHKSIYSIPTVNLASNFLEDKNGYLWVSTGGNGLLKFDQHKNLVQQYKHDPLDSFSLPDNNVGQMFPYQENTFLVNSHLGIRVFNSLTNKFSKFSFAGPFKDSDRYGFTRIFLDRQGIMWFGRWGLGLIRYNPKDKSTKQFFNNADDTTSITSNEINSILEDASGTLWIAGSGGINRLNRKTYRFTNYLKGTFITYLYEDSRGNLLAGSEKGLYQYIQKEDRFTNFFDPQSEINSFMVGGIIEDNAKNLWLTSSSGIIKLDPVTKKTFIYGSSFGINPNTLAPYTRTYKNEKGQLYIGYYNGVYILSPEQLAVKTDFKILITNLFVNTLPVLPGKESPIQKPIEEISDLDLKYNQNNIAFDFATIDYRQPEATRYFTMLENYDNTWREVRGEKSSYYFNVSPGTYVYRVKAFNSEGTKAEKAITVTVNPPFWQTWWFRTLVGIFLVASLYAIYRWRTASLRRQKIVLERTVIERTAEVVEEKAEVERQKEKSDELLLNILPSEVAEELKEKGYTTAKSFDEVTVLFSDIKGFTNVAEKMTAQELVKEINTYFSAFDGIIQKYGLEKIKTIGDAYIAAGGLPEKNTATVQNVVEAAIAMQHIVEKLKQERASSNKPYFELRIGIHTGPVVAGVVGIKKFQYDIWGDTVNMAARMEQSGIPGKINISQHTYGLVNDQFTCVHRGKIDAKNKGEIDMYLVEGLN
jgi:class 3 adenylate cyclase/ligand-binding sensor domain-containing protein